MTDGKRKALRVAAIVIVLASLALQGLFIIVSWLSFDSRLSCGRLMYWGEWIACLHGNSHFHILITEVCVATWVVAGIGLALGRFLPPYISVVVIGGLTAVLIWFLQDNFRSMLSLDKAVFMASAATILLAGPTAAAWLWGVSRRRRSSPLLRLSAVFDSAR